MRSLSPRRWEDASDGAAGALGGWKLRYEDDRLDRMLVEVSSRVVTELAGRGWP